MYLVSSLVATVYLCFLIFHGTCRLVDADFGPICSAVPLEGLLRDSAMMRRTECVLATRALRGFLYRPLPRGTRLPNCGLGPVASQRWKSSSVDDRRRDSSPGTAPAKRSYLVDGLMALSSRVSAIGSVASNSPYGRLMRLDKPIGTHLLFLPTAWGITVAAASVGDAASLCALTYGGAVIMRGAGCTMNDLWDQDIDQEVERTRSRPLAAGEISVPAGFAFLGLQLSAGLGVLLSLSNYAICVGAPSVIPVLLYPLAKRVTDYPQAVLGLTINWGALVGYAAAADALAAPAFWFYGAGWCWTMIYDTIYAHQDKVDDARIGVRSSALALAGGTKPALGVLAVAKVGLLTAAGLSAGLSAPYFGGVGLVGAHLVRQIIVTDLDSPEQCLKAFVSNSSTGALLWAAIAAGRVF